MHSKKLVLPWLMLFCLILFAGGCGTAKKPAPPNMQNTNNNQVNIGTASSKAVADRAIKEANSVVGVRGASAVVSGKEVYIGLDLNADVKNDKVSAIERSVLNRVKNALPDYTIYVTSDIDTVTGLKNIASGIARGTPLSSFKNELDTLNSRITLKSK